MTEPPEEETATHTTSLHRLAQDDAFGWALVDPAAGKQPVHKKLTSTRVAGAARAVLRANDFKLAFSGVAQASAQATSRHQPPPLAFGDAAFSAPFDEAARDVDVLLAAVRRSRTWDKVRLRTLCVEQAGWTGSWRELHEILLKLFGPNQRADFVVPTTEPIGASMAPPVREIIFNERIDRSVVSAVNAILTLISISAGLGVSTEPQPRAAAQAAQHREDDDDVAAARILVAAATAFNENKSLRIVQPLSKDDFLDRLMPALVNVRPDWVLVSGPEGSYDIHGVIESKPFAELADLQELASPRRDPLSSKHVPGNQGHNSAAVAAVPPQTSATRTNPSSALRQSERIAQSIKSGQPGPCYAESREESESARRAKDVESHPERGPEFGYVTVTQGQKLLLQISSQLGLCGIRHALIWGAWGTSLVAVELRRHEEAAGSHSDGSDNPSSSPSSEQCFALRFAGSALNAVVADDLGNLLGLDEMSSSSSSSDPSPPALAIGPLDFTSKPNIVMGLVQWALYAHRQLAQQGRLFKAEDPGAVLLVEDEDAGKEMEQQHDRRQPQDRKRAKMRSDPPRQAPKANGSGPPPSTRKSRTVPGQAPLSSSSSSSSLSSHPRSSPPTSPDKHKPCAPPAIKSQGCSGVRVELFSFARGAFADVHRAVLQRPGHADQAVVCKFNRPAAGESEEEGRKAAQQRFETEKGVLKKLKHLQGTVLPKFWGTASADNTMALPKGASKALILEDVGRPIFSWDAWPASMLHAERRRLVEAAFAKLHDHGVCHGDVAARNVCVSLAPAPSSPGAYPSDVSPSVRVCLVDLTEAFAGSGDAEANEVRQMLDNVFGRSS